MAPATAARGDSAAVVAFEDFIGGAPQLSASVHGGVMGNGRPQQDMMGDQICGGPLGLSPLLGLNNRREGLALGSEFTRPMCENHQSWLGNLAMTSGPPIVEFCKWFVCVGIFTREPDRFLRFCLKCEWNFFLVYLRVRFLRGLSHCARECARVLV